MDHYCDIRIKPDAEMRENVLLNKVYTKFHKALCDLSSKSVGVSFPETKLKLGKVLRVHSSQSNLKALKEMNWLGGLISYCEYSEVQTIPENVEHRTVSRWRPNMTESHLRRLIKRRSISEDEIKAYRAKMYAAQLTTLPYLELESTGSGQLYRRYIQVSDPVHQAVGGDFDQFGLSKKATIPWF
ncbi:type I-F CRISPR-associated endoribonuclease Cas6/Csy4 [Marinomonas sp. THO17]|uniref:type I-F CRISPR-associated endoribonuclease Cas6/Csy4 n=1 Tax=Marinomonas sp. THO17 TaxID=3149048 RepID=UPI00336BBB5F